MELVQTPNSIKFPDMSVKIVWKFVLASIALHMLKFGETCFAYAKNHSYKISSHLEL